MRIIFRYFSMRLILSYVTNSYGGDTDLKMSRDIETKIKHYFIQNKIDYILNESYIDWFRLSVKSFLVISSFGCEFDGCFIKSINLDKINEIIKNECNKRGYFKRVIDSIRVKVI